MGYRSTFVTDDSGLKLPAWFVEKWQSLVYFNEAKTLPISSKQEMKAYGAWQEITTDLQRVLKEDEDSWRSIHFIFLHEDGATTQYHITAESVTDVRQGNNID